MYQKPEQYSVLHFILLQKVIQFSKISLLLFLFTLQISPRCLNIPLDAEKQEKSVTNEFCVPTADLCLLLQAYLIKKEAQKH